MARHNASSGEEHVLYGVGRSRATRTKNGQCEACPAPGAATEALADRRASAADVPPRYGCSDPDRLSAEPRSALVDLWLTPEGLTVWVLQAAERSGAHVDGAADAPSLLLHVRRTAAVARLLPAGD